MGLTRLAIARPVAILMIVGAFLVLGLIGFTQLPAELNPNVQLPTITIRTNYPGTNPQEMETLITKPIEDSIAGVSGIQEIDSTSQEGTSTITLQFYYGTDLNAAESDTIQKVDAIRNALPIESQSPSVIKADTNGRPVLTLAMMSKTESQQQLQSLATNIVEPALEQGTDVGEVDISQVSTREIRIAADPAKLASLGVTLPQIVTAIGAANVNVSSGFIQTNNQYYNVNLIGEFASVDEIRDLRLTVASGSSSSGSVGIGTPAVGFSSSTLSSGSSSSTGSSSGSKTFYLTDVANVTDTSQEKTTASFFDGQPAVTINILKTTDGNTVAAVDSCLQQLKSVKVDLPPDVSFAVAFDQSQQVRENLDDVVTSLFLGALLAILVVYIFLHNARGTIIVGIAIPTSMIATFLPIWAMGFTLNTMTLLGLSLAVGILVDDSIVVLENINRHLQLGEEPVIAAINGRTEIGLAALILTSVDLVVFLPIAFMGGIIGEFFRSFGVTVAIATLFSLFVSFTLTPMLAARWYRKGESLEASDKFAKGFDRFFEKVEGIYQRILRFCTSYQWNASYEPAQHNRASRALMGTVRWFLRGPVITLVIANSALALVFIFIGSQLGFRFSPDQDQGQVSVIVEAPAGVSVAYTQRITDQIESIVRKTPDLNSDVEFITTRIGSAGPGMNVSGPQYANVSLTLYDKKSVLDDISFWNHAHLRTRSDVLVANEIGKLVRHIPGARIMPANVSGFGGGGPPLAIYLSGPDLNKLTIASSQVENILKKTAGTYNVDSTFQANQPEVDIRLDRTKAPEYGLSLEDVGNALSASIAGDTSVQYRDPADGEEYNIRVQLTKDYRNDPAGIANVIVGYQNGNPIHLGDVADVSVGTGPVKIDRMNRQRDVQVTSYILPGYSVGKISLSAIKQINALHLQQVQASFGGETQSIQREGGYLVTAFLLGIILTYMLMAALFNNVAYPFSIMLSLPQAWAGGVIALWLAHEQLSLISMIGVVLLNAIVNKNAILLVDYTNTLRGRGYTREDAIMLAGPTRLRPIMMTSFTILVSTLPTALALGRGAEFRQSLGVVVEGGITLSLFLTLIVVPAAYILYDNLTEYVARTMRNWIAKHPLPTSHAVEGNGHLPPASGGNGTVRPLGSASAPALMTKPRGNGYQNGDGKGHGNGSGDAASRKRGKYGGITIRNRRPDELFERLIKGGDDHHDPTRN